MAKYGLEISVIITKDGQPFHERSQKSHNLDDQQFIEMEQDLFDVEKKWAAASGLKA